MAAHLAFEPVSAKAGSLQCGDPPFSFVYGYAVFRAIDHPEGRERPCTSFLTIDGFLSIGLLERSTPSARADEPAAACHLTVSHHPKGEGVFEREGTRRRRPVVSDAKRLPAPNQS